MASSFLDVCRFNPAAGGTADWTYSSAVVGYQGPLAAGVANGATYSYRAESNDLTQWEIGTGTYNTATSVLSRTTVLYNSSGGSSKINFSTTPQVAIVALAEDLPSLANNNSLAGTQNVTNTTEATGAGTTAAAIIAGGLEVLKKLFVAGIAKFTNSTASTSTTTGAVVVTGGLGVSGDIYAGNTIHAMADPSSTASIRADTSYSLTNGSSKTFFSGVSGLAIITEGSIFGNSCAVLCGANDLTIGWEASPASTIFVKSSTPAAGKIGVYFSTPNYIVKNNTGSTINIWICAIQTRPNP
jgi:hypothetical protein